MVPQSGFRVRRVLHWLLAHPWYPMLAISVVLFTNWVIGTRSESHHVRAEFASAFNLVAGQPVDVDGLQVGKIAGVQYDSGTPAAPRSSRSGSATAPIGHCTAA